MPVDMRMRRDQLVISTSIIATFVLGALASLVPLDWSWGLNHLQFLPPWFTWIYLTLAAMAIAVMLLPTKATAPDSIVGSTNRMLWGERHWPRVAFALILIPIFYFLQAETHFLGDGYGWLGNLSHQGSYIQKWTALGSLTVVRFVQTLFGSASEQTALAAFQVVSISSGVITVYNLLSIVGRLCSDRSLRVFGIIVIMTGGWLLLFFGYVEVYPVFWAAVTTWLSLSLRYFQEGKGLGWVIVTYAISLLMHVQAIYLLAGFLWLVAGRLLTRRKVLRITRTYWISFSLTVIAGGAAIYWLRNELLELEMMTLPLLTGRPASPDYAVFSLKHLVDIANLSFLIVPAALPLLVLSRPWRWLGRLDAVTIFLALSGAGSFFFLLIVDPVIGLGRDWDLFSFTILCLALLLLRGCHLIEAIPAPRILIATLLLGLSLSGSYLATNMNMPSSEQRFHSLLSHYGSKDYSGWIIYANYMRRAARMIETINAEEEISHIFPNETVIARAIEMLKRGDVDGALKLAMKVIDDDPYHPASLGVIGQAYTRLKQYGKAEEYLDLALRLRPHFASFQHSMAQVYFGQQRFAEALEMSRKAHRGDPNQQTYLKTHAMVLFYNNELDSVEVIAENFLAADSCSPHGNVLMLKVAIERRIKAEARKYYHAYEACGALTPDYQEILNDHRFVLDD